MAIIRNILILTFEDGVDTFNDKQRMKQVFIQQGYMPLAETKMEETGILKEIIMQSPVQIGKFYGDPQQQEEKQAKIIGFDPSGGGK